jgi:phage terminase large subunit GpA-like protein
MPDDLSTEELELENAIRSRFVAGFKPPFRGEIWENSAGIPMGRGYSNDGAPFDINSAHYLKEPLRAVKNPAYRKVIALAAVQMLKTFAMIDEASAFFIEHEPGDMNIYMPDAEAARDHMRGRLLPRLRAIPGVAVQLDAVAELDRFDITTQEFYLPGMVLRCWPLNEGNTQRMTLRYVLISDAFLAGRKGLINQAIARTTQHPHDKKVIIESQGGEEGDDFDIEWKSTDMRRLHVRCPLCDGAQEFVFHAEREEKFRARLPRERVREILEKHGCAEKLDEVMREF